MNDTMENTPSVQGQIVIPGTQGNGGSLSESFLFILRTMYKDEQALYISNGLPWHN